METGEAEAMIITETHVVPDPGPVPPASARPSLSMAYGPDVCSWLLDR